MMKGQKRTQIHYVEIAKKTYRVTSRTKDFDQRIFVSSQPLKKEHDLKHQLSIFVYIVYCLRVSSCSSAKQ